MSGWVFAPIVRELTALRGLDVVIASAVVAEVGDFARFENPRRPMSYFGLVPGEFSSGASIRPRSSASRRRSISCAYTASPPKTSIMSINLKWTLSPISGGSQSGETGRLLQPHWKPTFRRMRNRIFCCGAEGSIEYPSWSSCVLDPFPICFD